VKVDFAYFKAAGRSLEIVGEWQAKVRAFFKAAEAIKDEVGAAAVAHFSHERVAGFEFANGAPNGWRQQKRTGLYWPLRKSKEGKALSDRIEALRAPRLEDMLGYRQLMIVGNGWRSLGLYGINDEEDAYVIAVPLDAEGKPFFEPQDAVRIKASEFLAMRGSNDPFRYRLVRHHGTRLHSRLDSRQSRPRVGTALPARRQPQTDCGKGPAVTFPGETGGKP
jgi:hypothetical protein